MAHCAGDAEGTWLVLAILQGTAGEFKGVKAPFMELIARKSWNEQKQQQQQGNGRQDAVKAEEGDNRWMYYKQTNELPQNGGAEALVALLQQHVPELLGDMGGEAAEGQRRVMGRQVLFNWVTPCFAVGGSSRGAGSSSSSWYVDLLTPAVERLGAGSSSSSSSSSSSNVAGASNGGASVLQRQLSLLPPGVFRMDDYLEQRRNK
jgi:hypothetical protein